MNAMQTVLPCYSLFFERRKSLSTLYMYLTLDAKAIDDLLTAVEDHDLHQCN